MLPLRRRRRFGLGQRLRLGGWCWPLLLLLLGAVLAALEPVPPQVPPSARSGSPPPRREAVPCQGVNTSAPKFSVGKRGVPAVTTFAVATFAAAAAAAAAASVCVQSCGRRCCL